jgi:3-phenylpropionate/trans-cinnamate dioxygenase ferredoxin reductase component
VAPRNFLVIGAGKAGCHAAEAIRAADPSGKVILVGQEAHPPYERPPLSKDLLMDDASRIADILVRPPQNFSDIGIDLRLSTRVTRLEPTRHVAHTDRGAIPYDRVLIATGARPRSLPQARGMSAGRIYHLRTFEDAQRLRHRLRDGVRIIIIGAGLIGLEVAAAAKARGCEVTVMERSGKVAARVACDEVANALLNLHRDNGVKFLLHTCIEAVEERGREVVLTLEDGSETRADAVLVSIGVEAGDELAREAALDTHDGIRTDEYGRTSHPDVFAAGDVASSWHRVYQRHLRSESWQTALAQARVVGGNMAGAGEAYLDIPVQWSSQNGKLLHCAGSSDGCDLTLGCGDIEAFAGAVYFFKDRCLRAVQGFSIGREVRAAIRLIAAQQVIPSRMLDEGFDPVAAAKAGSRGELVCPT